MKAYNDIQGWFDFEDVYNFLIEQTPTNGMFVECGAWLGKSSAYLCDKATQKNITVYIVDSWLGSTNELNTTHKLATQLDIYNLFLTNMGDRKFTPIRQLSSQAINNFDDDSCDVIFIDMNHEYESVKNDIKLWLPKVKFGGYLAGHDYNSGWPGVIKAVNEMFGKSNLEIKSHCWIHQRTEG